MAIIRIYARNKLNFIDEKEEREIDMNKLKADIYKIINEKENGIDQVELMRSLEIDQDEYQIALSLLRRENKVVFISG